jgi:hypothetical protein
MSKLELLDILTGQDNTPNGGIDERQNFTVDTTGPLDVAINGPYAYPVGTLRPGNMLDFYIPLNEPIIVQSIGISMPYQFGMSNQSFNVELYANGNANVPLFATSIFVEMPFVNYEMAIGVFVPFPATMTQKYRILMFVDPASAKVSMVNAPAALNAATLPITCFAKISHTRPLSA